MKNIDRRKAAEWLLVIFAGLVASFPLMFQGIDGMGHQDLQFHLSRIEGLAEGLRAVDFPVMMQSVWMEGKGYPVSIFYGDLLLYPAAMGRLLGLPVVLNYKLFVLCINLLTAAVTYVCLKKLFEGGIAAVVGSFLYVTASYRLVDIYVRNAVGEYCAFLFFPILALALYRLLGEEGEIFRDALTLIVGMTGLLETHLLSTIMATFLMGVVCVLALKRVLRRRALITLGCAVVGTVLLNLYYLVPFLDYYLNVPIYGGKGGDNTSAKLIRQYGAYPEQLFSFFARPFGSNTPVAELRMQLTIGLPLMLALALAFVYFLRKGRKYSVFVCGFMAALCLWMSTNLFPWNSLEGYTHLFRLLAKVQFPWRYLAPAAFFAALLLTLVLSEVWKEESARWITACSGSALMILAVVMVLFFSIQYRNGYQPVAAKTYEECNSYYMGACEYLKNNTTLKDLEYVPQNESFEVCEIRAARNNTVRYYVENGEEYGRLEVDKLNYPGYVAVAEDGELLPVVDGFNDLITVIVPRDYAGEITVTFRQPLLWRVSEILSLMTLLGLLGIFVLHSKGRKAREPEKD